MSDDAATFPKVDLEKMHAALDEWIDDAKQRPMRAGEKMFITITVARNPDGCFSWSTHRTTTPVNWEEYSSEVQRWVKRVKQLEQRIDQARQALEAPRRPIND